jgi:hypothetical protein
MCAFRLTFIGGKPFDVCGAADAFASLACRQWVQRLHDGAAISSNSTEGRRGPICEETYGGRTLYPVHPMSFLQSRRTLLKAKDSVTPETI